MTQVIEYIMQNYTWFLFGTIIILLAIIGYYADKTNFGQGKNSETDDKTKINIDKLGLMDITSDIASKEKNLNLQNTDSQTLNLSNNQSSNGNQGSQLETNSYNENIQDNNFSDASVIANMQLPEIDTIQTNVSQESAKPKEVIDEVKNEPVISDENGSNSAIIEEINKQFNSNNNDIFNNEIREKIEEETKKREEEFNRFNDEFNSLLPRRELINGDLLGEIDDLQLDKTQKLDFSDLTKFEKIELPRISESIEQEQDIWKF